ncbi:MAG TPA: hypothetical protein VIM42_09355 [Clostridium sp.]
MLNQDMLIGLFILLAMVSLIPMVIGFVMNKKVLKIISFVAIIVFNLTVFGVLWMNK